MEDVWYTPPSSPTVVAKEPTVPQVDAFELPKGAQAGAQVGTTGAQVGTTGALERAPLADPTFLAFFYHHVAAAGHHALDKTGLWSHFQMEDITMVGGAVMAVYDTFSSCLPATIKQTHDMDFTWYLRADPLYPCSHPNAVGRLGEEMVQQLQTQLTHPLVLGHIQRTLGPFPLPPANAPATWVAPAPLEIKGKNMVATYGSYAIAIRIYGQTLADLTLHDGFCSQTYDDQHAPIPYPRATPMYQDPMYPADQRVVPVVEGIWPVRVPSPEVYVRQQLFAAGNLLIAGKEKGYRLMERVVYLLQAQCTSAMMSLLLEKLMMLQKWPGSEARMERLKPILRIIKDQLEKWYGTLPRV
jgi:hypothetical protein